MNPTGQQITAELSELVREGRCELVGLVEDHEKAAEANHDCRRDGVPGSVVDCLLCAISVRRSWSIFTTDPDFISYSKVLPLGLHAARS